MALQHGQRIWCLRQNKTCLFRIAIQRRLLIKKLVLPDLLLSLPIHSVSLLYRPAELDLPKVFALGELGSNVDFAVAVPGHAVRDYMAIFRLYFDVGTGEAGFDCVCAVVEDESFGRRRWSGRLRVAMTRRHGRGDIVLVAIAYRNGFNYFDFVQRLS